MVDVTVGELVALVTTTAAEFELHDDDHWRFFCCMALAQRIANALLPYAEGFWPDDPNKRGVLLDARELFNGVASTIALTAFGEGLDWAEPPHAPEPGGRSAA